jgi:HK97 family phage prohead protease
MFQTYNAAVEYGTDGLPLASRHIPPQVLEFYKDRATCAFCHLRIRWPEVQVATRGIHMYHPSCAQRVLTVVDKPATPRVIAQIGGSLPVFDHAGCCVVLPGDDGQSYSEHERFLPDCFDDSIAAGGQQLLVNHGDVGALSGNFRTLRNDGGELRFSFALLDGSLERRMLEKITRAELRGLSFAFDKPQPRCERHSVVYVRARLKEISLLTETRRPAWFGSRVWVEATW